MLFAEIYTVVIPVYMKSAILTCREGAWWWVGGGLLQYAERGEGAEKCRPPLGLRSCGLGLNTNLLSQGLHHHRGGGSHPVRYTGDPYERDFNI